MCRSPLSALERRAVHCVAVQVQGGVPAGGQTQCWAVFVGLHGVGQFDQRGAVRFLAGMIESNIKLTSVGYLFRRPGRHHHRREQGEYQGQGHEQGEQSFRFHGETSLLKHGAETAGQGKKQRAVTPGTIRRCGALSGAQYGSERK